MLFFMKVHTIFVNWLTKRSIQGRTLLIPNYSMTFYIEYYHRFWNIYSYRINCFVSFFFLFNTKLKPVCVSFGRILTGSFDKTVKIWSIDGKLVHKLDNFISSVTGVCFVPLNTTIWVAGGLSNAILYDPKSGENVREFVFLVHIFSL